jgi:two-component system, NarL family, sensor histidine kinase UhpB
MPSIAVASKSTPNKNQKSKTELQRFAMLNAATGEGIWDYDLVTGFTVYNQNMHAMFGYSSVEMRQNKRWWEANLHPQDKSRIINSLNQTLLTDTDTWKGQYLFQCKDGTYKTVHERIFIERDTDGTALRIIGTMQDVAETALAKNEQQQHQQAHMQTVIKNIFMADEMERKQMGDELHENINQVLAAINFHIQAAQQADASVAAKNLSAAQALIKTTMKGVSAVSYKLAPLTLQLLGITTLLNERLNKLRNANNINVVLNAADNLDNLLSYEKQLVVFRIVTMQLQNVCLHAYAAEVIVKLKFKNKQLHIVVEDNGVGFSMAAMQYGGGFSKMQSFATAYNGSFNVYAQAGKGCRIEVLV